MMNVLVNSRKPDVRSNRFDSDKAPAEQRPGFLVRAAIPDDANSLSALAIQVWLHTYAVDGVSGTIARYVLNTHCTAEFLRLIKNTHYVLPVALRGDYLIGYALARFDAVTTAMTPTPELQTLYVQTGSVGRGIGTALLRAIQDETAQRRGGSGLTLSVNAKNRSAFAFYRHHDFIEYGVTNFYLDAIAHENYLLRGPASAPQADCQQIRAVRSSERAGIAVLITETLETSVDASAEEKAHFLSSMLSNLEWACQHPDQCVHLVYIRAKRLVGVILVKEHWNLCALMVEPAEHRSGVGVALLDLAVMLCRGRSPQAALRLNASRNAVGFYLAQGFEIVEGADALQRTTPMQRQL